MQLTQVQRNWLCNAAEFAGSFLKSFVDCWFKADEQNQELLWPVLEKLMLKYPVYFK